MIKVVTGDLFASQARTLINPVNCVGVMGKGMALEFKRRWPEMFADYQRRCERREVHLGEPCLYRDASGISILNFPTKGHWRSPSRLVDIERGLDYLVAHVAEWHLTNIAMPALGCGHGGLAWAEVGQVIFRKLRDLPIDVEVYAPHDVAPRSSEALVHEPASIPRAIAL